MTDAQYIAIATVLFAPWLMWSVMRHQRRAKDGSAKRRDANAARPGGRQPGPQDAPDTPETSSTSHEMEGK